MCSGTCNCPGMLVLVCVVHVCSCAFFLSLCACACACAHLCPPAPPQFLESCVADSLQAGWPAICSLFLFFFNSENTQAHELLPKQLRRAVFKMSLGLFSRFEQGVFLGIRKTSLNALSSGFPLDLAVEGPLPVPNLRTGGTSWSDCVFIYFCFGFVFKVSGR